MNPFLRLHHPPDVWFLAIGYPPRRASVQLAIPLPSCFLNPHSSIFPPFFSADFQKTNQIFPLDNNPGAPPVPDYVILFSRRSLPHTSDTALGDFFSGTPPEEDSRGAPCPFPVQFGYHFSGRSKLRGFPLGCCSCRALFTFFPLSSSFFYFFSHFSVFLHSSPQCLFGESFPLPAFPNGHG